jgi:antitoxin HigA-1
VAKHPGRVLAEEFMSPKKISQNALAKTTGIQQGTLSKIIKGTLNINLSYALALSKALGTTVEFWVNLQKNYDRGINEQK